MITIILTPEALEELKMRRFGCAINQDMLADIKELHQSLYYMYSQHGCSCGNPACKRCVDSSDNGEVLSRIEEKYHTADGWSDETNQR